MVFSIIGTAEDEDRERARRERQAEADFHDLLEAYDRERAGCVMRIARHDIDLDNARSRLADETRKREQHELRVEIESLLLSREEIVASHDEVVRTIRKLRREKSKPANW